MPLKNMIDTAFSCANQLFQRKSASAFRYYRCLPVVSPDEKSLCWSKKEEPVLVCCSQALFYILCRFSLARPRLESSRSAMWINMRPISVESGTTTRLKSSVESNVPRPITSVGTEIEH